MIELLTQRRAEGWAHVTDDSTMPIRVRVRDGESVLAQIELPAQTAISPMSSPEKNYPFRIEFPAVSDPKKLIGLTIEAARPESDRWCALPRHLKIWGSYLQAEPPIAANPDGTPRSRNEGTSSRELPYWSDDGTTTVSDSESRPVFVVGAARSGTSAICLALWKGTRYRGFSEGHVLDIGIRLVNAVNAHFEKKDSWISLDTSAGYHLGRMAPARIQAEAIAMFRRLASGYTTPYWLDKTPTYQMVASVPVIAQAWPQARFLFMKRRGLENLRSRTRKFPGSNFAGHCRDWALIMSGWRAVRETVSGKFVEIDQRDMLNNPASTGTQVGRLLGLQPAEVEEFTNVLRRERPESTHSSDGIVHDLSQLNWTVEQMETFRGVCGAEMDAYGYTYDARYCG